MYIYRYIFIYMLAGQTARLDIFFFKFRFKKKIHRQRRALELEYIKM